MLLVMGKSSIDMWTSVASAAQEAKNKSAKAARTEEEEEEEEEEEAGASTVLDPRLTTLVQCMAAIQILLAVMAFTSYHVQIVTRISSAYPVWYWWLVQGLVGGTRAKLSGGLVVFMVMYASIQGILFASFLPPA